MNPETAWMSNGLCREVDSELFFPPSGSDGRPARAVCALCEVLEQCRNYALTHPVMGVWGGLSENERLQAGVQIQPLRLSPVSVCKSEAGYQRHMRRGETPCVDCTIAMTFVRQERAEDDPQRASA